MTDAQGKEAGICAGPGLSHELLWDGGSTERVREREYERD